MDYPAYSVMTVYYISTTQSSNRVVSIVEHVYRMIALLLYITSRNSPRCGRLGLFLDVIYKWRLAGRSYITSRISPRTLIMSFICNLFVLIWGYSWRLYINAVWPLSL